MVLTPSARKSISKSSPLFRLSILVAISLLIWWHPLIASLALALRDDQYTHLLLILPVSVTLIFLDWKSSETPEDRRSGPGVILLVAAIVATTFARSHILRLHPDEQLSLKMLALVLWWIGAFIVSFGTRAFRRALFPLCLLFWFVPIPEFILSPIVQWLQQGSVVSARALFALAGVPSAQDGIQITIPGLTVEVAVPLSVAKNGLRIFVLAMLTTRVDRSFITGRLHHQGGIIYFLIALMTIILFIWTARWGNEETRELGGRSVTMGDTRLSSQRLEPMFKNHHKVHLRPVHVIFFLAVCVLGLLIAYALRLLATAGRVSPSATLATAQPNLPSCPPGVVPMLAPSSQTGHHKVTLTWNPSTFYPDPQRHAVGYCLYRGTAPIIAKEIRKCLNCEQINKTAINATACVDNLVQDGVLYYYVAAAVNQEGGPSLFSNSTTALIPSTKVPATSPAATTYPLCRASNGKK